MVLANSPFCFVNCCHVICKTIETSHLECKQQQGRVVQSWVKITQG